MIDAETSASEFNEAIPPPLSSKKRTSRKTAIPTDDGLEPDSSASKAQIKKRAYHRKNAPADTATLPLLPAAEPQAVAVPAPAPAPIPPPAQTPPPAPPPAAPAPQPLPVPEFKVVGEDDEPAPVRNKPENTEVFVFDPTKIIAQFAPATPLDTPPPLHSGADIAAEVAAAQPIVVE
ncbi:MAG: hypothetical protein LBV54_07965, partial [Puniceicoccales bacterium]|nr:hypothetical protein [Puniceicoccales bacterium]